MYETFYQLAESPFGVTPDPRYLYFGRRHREAFDHLLYGLERRTGFIQLTGEVGAGKTTLCRALLDELDDRFRTALILNPSLTETQLLRAILAELDLDASGNDRGRLLGRLDRFLLARAGAEEEVVLVIDEAQDLSDPLLEQVRLLSNLETDDRKLLQIVLVGQPELKARLDGHGMRQLRQRIRVRYHLAPLDRAETADYVAHRLAVAGARGRPSFTPAAIRAIHRYSRGIPRLVNAACDATMVCGWVEERDRLGWWQVRRGLRSLEGRSG